MNISFTVWTRILPPNCVFGLDIEVQHEEKSALAREPTVKWGKRIGLVMPTATLSTHLIMSTSHDTYNSNLMMRSRKRSVPGLCSSRALCAARDAIRSKCRGTSVADEPLLAGPVAVWMSR